MCEIMNNDAMKFMITANTDTKYEQNWIVWLIGLAWNITETSGQIWNVKYTKTKARQTEQRLTATDLCQVSRSGCVVMKQLDLDLSINQILDLIDREK